ncbi:MAG: hypothetical protein KDC84_15950, partial [Crocinitomicaceae bacterium]|nr:hypothetical protein [Crocinitomicaceae bacterium]
MDIGIASYQIQIIDEPIQFGQQEYAKKVEIKTFVEEELVDISFKGWLDKKVIYDHLEKKEPILFENA